MAQIRYAPKNQLSEVTARTQQSRFLLRPSPEVNDTILGVIGRALSLYDVRLHAFVFMSNHYHMLVTADDAGQLSKFMGHVNGNVAREINRLAGWSGRFWQRRFRAIPVDGCTADQLARLRYLLSHGVKERLVRRAREWPGASSLPWLLHGETVAGTWHDRTGEYNYMRRKSRPDTGKHHIRYELKFTPLPCFDGMAEAQWRAEVQEMVDEIEAENAGHAGADEARRPGAGAVLGAAKVLAMDPHARPRTTKWSKAPVAHAQCKQARKKWRAMFRGVRKEHAAASRRFGAGEFDVEFPLGTFRPNGGFVRWRRADRAGGCEITSAGADLAA